MIIVFFVFLAFFGLIFWAQVSNVNPGIDPQEFERIKGRK